MQISHLVHGSASIRCKVCGAEFEVSKHALSDPERLVSLKEGIAASHTCNNPRAVPVVPVLQFPNNESLAAYWSKETRRLMA